MAPRPKNPEFFTIRVHPRLAKYIGATGMYVAANTFLVSRVLVLVFIEQYYQASHEGGTTGGFAGLETCRRPDWIDEFPSLLTTPAKQVYSSFTASFTASFTPSK